MAKNGGDKPSKIAGILSLGRILYSFWQFFLLEWFGQRAWFVKYIYCFNETLTGAFGDKNNGYCFA